MSHLPLTQWKIRAVNPPDHLISLAQWTPCLSPFLCPEVMVRAGHLPDPILTTGEKIPLLDGMSWEAVCEIPPHPAGAKLCFEGLDTCCELFLDGVLFAETDNQFRRYEFEIGEGKELRILFRCARAESRKRAEAWGTPMDWNGFSYTGKFFYPFVRKAAYSGGWDWLNPLPLSAGITGSATLYIPETMDITIRNLDYQISLSNDLQTAEITPVAEIESTEDQVTLADLQADELDLIPAERLFLKRGIHSYSLRKVRIFRPRLWFPNKMGSPACYTLTFRCRSQNGWITDERKIGIRKIRLLHGEEGTDFRFEINGKEVQARGANWIPVDPYPSRVSEERIRRRLELAAEGNLNMIRVWGGGFYESNLFYNLCDELGLMVWQDFPFACNNYPEEPAFLESIRAETADNLKRIRHHPSLVLLCGNNESHCCHFDWLKRGDNRFFGEEIYHRLLPECVTKFAPEIPYWPGSPWNPVDRNAPSAPEAGDRHAWQCVFGAPEDRADAYRLADETGKFISEFGLIAMPDWQSMLETGAVNETAMATRSNYAVNPERLRAYTEQVLPLSDDFRTYCRQTQFAQAKLIGHAVDAWRRRNCGGILLWHWADCWVAPSWGAVDGMERPRLLWHMLKRAFAPDHLSIEGDMLIFTSDSPASVTAEILYFEEGILSETMNLPMIGGRCPINPNRFFHARVINGKVLTERSHLPSLPSWKPKLKVTAVRRENGHFTAELTTDRFFPHVWLHADSADPNLESSEQDFTLIPGENRIVSLRSKREKLPALQLKTALRSHPLTQDHLSHH